MRSRFTLLFLLLGIASVFSVSAQDFLTENIYEGKARQSFDKLFPVAEGFVSIRFTPSKTSVMSPLIGESFNGSSIYKWDKDFKLKDSVRVPGNWELYSVGRDSFLLLDYKTAKPYPCPIYYRLIDANLKTLRSDSFLPIEGTYHKFLRAPEVIKYGKKVILAFTKYEKDNYNQIPKKDLWYLIDFEIGCEQLFTFKEVTSRQTRVIDIHRKMGAGLVKLMTVGLVKPKVRKKYKTRTYERAILKSAPTFHYQDSVFFVSNGHLVDLGTSSYIEVPKFIEVYGDRTSDHIIGDSTIQYINSKKTEKAQFLGTYKYHFANDSIETVYEKKLSSKLTHFIGTIELNNQYYMSFYNFDTKYKDHRDQKAQGVCAIRHMKSGGRIDRISYYLVPEVNFSKLVLLSNQDQDETWLMLRHHPINNEAVSITTWGTALWKFDKRGNLINKSTYLKEKTKFLK